MKRSAAASSSSVLTPGRILPAIKSSVAAWMRPAAAIFSISSGDFLMITLGAYLSRPGRPTCRSRQSAAEPCISGLLCGAPSRDRSTGADSRTALQLVLEPQRRDRGPDVIVHLVWIALPVEAAQQARLLVVVDQRGGLTCVHLQAPADCLLLVVVALDQARAVLIA